MLAKAVDFTVISNSNAPIKLENGYLVTQKTGLWLIYGYVYVGNVPANGWLLSYLGVWLPNGTSTVYGLNGGRSAGVANSGNSVSGMTIVNAEAGTKFKLCGYYGGGSPQTQKNTCQAKGLFWE